MLAGCLSLDGGGGGGGKHRHLGNGGGDGGGLQNGVGNGCNINPAGGYLRRTRIGPTPNNQLTVKELRDHGSIVLFRWGCASPWKIK